MGRKSREKRERRQQLNQDSAAPSESRFGLERACFYIVRWGIYLVLFSPLIIWKYSFFPFVTPKTIFFRIIIEIILVAYLFLAIINPRYRPRINIITIGIIIFLGVLFFTSFTGINFERSFWSTYERMTGLWTMLHLFAFFIILTSVFKERKEWEKILSISIIVGILLSFYFLFGGNIYSRRGGTIGNSSFMAAYLLFDIFFALTLFINNLTKKRWSWLIFLGGGLAIMLFVLFKSTARGAILSFLGGIFLLVLGYIFLLKNKLLKKIVLVAILLSVVFAVVILFFFRPAIVKNKAESILIQLKPRLTIWKMAWQGWQERFWLGWGPENFNVVFTKYFNPCLFTHECGGEVWFDRAHNIVLDMGVTSGLLGLLSYLFIFGTAIFSLLRSLLKMNEKRNTVLFLGMAVLLVVYFVQNLLVFDMISSYMIFFLTLAFISFLAYPVTIPSERKKTPLQINRKWQRRIKFTVVIISIFALWLGNIQPAFSAKNIAEIRNPNLKIEKVSVFFQKALNSLMLKYETREQFAQRVSATLSDPNQSKKALKDALELAIKEMKKSTKENPLDFRSHFLLGRLYLDYYRFIGDREKINLAEKTVEKAVKLSPKNQQGYWQLAQVRMYQGRYQAAINLLKKALELEPRLHIAHWELMLGYKLTGQYQLAEAELRKAEKLKYNWKNKIVNFKQVIDLYTHLGNNSKLVSLYQEALKLEPRDTQLWKGLATAYANLGEKEKAREAAMKVIEIDPSQADSIDSFLKILEKKE